MTDDNVHRLPPQEPPPQAEPLFALVGPFQPEYHVQFDGYMIALLTGYKREDGSVCLSLDRRFGADFPDEATAGQAAYLIANALAIGQGYPWYGAQTKDRPFASKGFGIAPPDAPPPPIPIR